jgi:hypothetical protein
LGRLGAPAAQPKPQRARPTRDLSLAWPNRLLPRLRSPPAPCAPGPPSSRASTPPTARAHQPPQQPRPRRRVKETGLLSPLLNPKLLSRSTPRSENRIANLELARSSSAPVEVNPPSPFPFPPPFFFVAVRVLAFVVVRGSPMAASATSTVRGSPGAACPRRVAPACRACCLARAPSRRVARRARGAVWRGCGLVRMPSSPRDDPRPGAVRPSSERATPPCSGSDPPCARRRARLAMVRSPPALRSRGGSALSARQGLAPPLAPIRCLPTVARGQSSRRGARPAQLSVLGAAVRGARRVAARGRPPV